MELNKTKVLIFIDWYKPAFKAGGPIQSVANIVGLLSKSHQFFIFTSSRDFGEIEELNVKKNSWIKSNSDLSIFYSDESFRRTSAVYKNLIVDLDPDIVYINSLFSKSFSIDPLRVLKSIKFKGKIILAPRGMLGKGALKLKAFKKRTFITLSKVLRLHKKVIWHASSDIEAQEIYDNYGKNSSVIVAPNLPNNLEALETNPPKSTGHLNLFFLSRISPKKNLHFALEVLFHITDYAICYSIIGPIEDKDYYEKCNLIIKELPKNIQVKFIGAVKPFEIPNYLKDQHFLFLPTLNENYGHVIIESLNLGKPVIISDQTPWLNLEKDQAGFDISLDDQIKFIEKIKSCAEMNQDEYDDLVQSTLEYAKRKSKDPVVIEQNKCLFSLSV